MNRTAPSIQDSSMLVGGTMIMSLSVYWDAWWHEAIGRESFWIPPHLGTYSGLFISLGGFFLLYREYMGRIPRSLWVYLGGIVGIIISGYADELWHQRYGVEKVGTIEAIWSPTHVAALSGGLVAALGIILYLSAATKTDTRLGWLIAGEFGVLVSITTLLLLPFGPETPFRLAGIWGAAPVAFAILALRFYGSVQAEKSWSLTLITGFNWTGNAMLLSNHAQLLTMAALVAVGVVPPVIADLLVMRGRRLKTVRNSYTIAGLEWGVIFGAFFYLLTNQLAFSSSYTPWDAASLAIIGITSALASTLAGFLAGSKSQGRMLARTLLFPKAQTRSRV